MRRAFSSSILSLLLLGTLVWGGCLSCEQYFMFASSKSCCAPNGHCKTKTTTPSNASGDCKQIAFDHQKSVDHVTELPLTATVKIDPPVRYFEPLGIWHGTKPIEPSPPDLQVLNSTFLI